MLRFGIVTQINAKEVQARVSFEDDNSTSFWLPVMQTKTQKDKYYILPDIGEQVVCLMDENSEDGVILGAIYSSEDKSLVESEQEQAINLENGNLININKSTQTLKISFSNIHLIGDIVHEGSFLNTNGITSSSDITDKTSSMQTIRDIYNSHDHTGNMGNSTSSPNSQM